MGPMGMDGLCCLISQLQHVGVVLCAAPTQHLVISTDVDNASIIPFVISSGLYYRQKLLYPAILLCNIILLVPRYDLIMSCC